MEKSKWYKSNFIDRYGGDHGCYTGKCGTPFEQRSLAPNVDNSPKNYHKYKVLRDIKGVEKAKIAPWFKQPGGGTQFLLPKPVKDLIKDGSLKEVKPSRLANAAPRALSIIGRIGNATMLLTPSNISRCQDLSYYLDNPDECR